MMYRRVEIIDGETLEPVQFVGVHTLRWPEGHTPTVAFIEDEASECLVGLFDAVDDYLYGQIVGQGYPEGHANPEYLSALRSAFLNASKALELSNNPNMETQDNLPESTTLPGNP